MTDVYGIKNCGTVKKALNWLDENGIEYTFHDYKKEGVDETKLKSWVKELGWESLLNRRGLTWRKLSDEEKSGINQGNAIKIMLEKPSIIKRPLIIANREKLLGFDEDEYQKFFD
ncbi:MAG: ArsC family reductase [Gammaproteobacteria bacterium]|nr:ArsC family reductase [Gammaproteobacteria bacterium]